MEIDTLSEKQQKFIFSKARHSAYVGGLGSGKTFSGCIKALLKMQKGLCGAIIAPTYRMLVDSTRAELLRIMDEAHLSYEFEKTNGIIKYKGSRVYLRSGENPERNRGPNLNWAWLDEAALQKEMSYKIMLGRLRLGVEQEVFITTTPAGFNWVYESFGKQERDGYLIVKARTDEAKWLGQEYIQDLKDSYTGEFARQELDGEFVSFEGLVYPEFKEHNIYKSEVKTDWQVYRAIDYGYTNPFVCLWGAVDEDGRIYVYREYYQRKRLLKDHAEVITSYPEEVKKTVADWDAQGNAEMRGYGINTIRANKDIIVGIQKVKNRLSLSGDGRPRLYISNNCVNTIKELSQYSWQGEKDGANKKELPVKENDHAMDALRYLVMSFDGNKREISSVF